MSLRLSNYLKIVLETQGESLVLLAGLIGEERTLHVLEERDDESDTPEIEPALFEIVESAASDFEEPLLGDDSDAYGELEQAMNRIYRFPHFQFYLWSYPGYRKWVESEFSLDEGLKASDDLIEKLSDDAWSEFHNWYKSLKIPAAIEASTLAVMERPWKKLKHELHLAAGLSPFRVIGK